MISKIKLGVNIDHVATIRNARGGMHPDPVKAALIAQNTGADNITAHLREDRRHISDIDIKKLMQKLRIPLNLEMAPTKEMLNIALSLNLKRICLVPEKRKEITTEGGLDVKKNKKKLGILLKKLFKKNIQVSLFINPNVNQINAAKDLKVSAIELNTGFFCEKIAAQGMICVMAGIDNLADGFLSHPANCTLERLGHGFDIQCVNDKAGVCPDHQSGI